MSRPTARRKIRHAIAFAVMVSAFGCSGPTLLLPGGELEGPVTPPPADWNFTRDVSTIQLETRPEDPYSVNIWAVGIGEALYVHAGANRARWIDHIEADPRVRVRVEGRIHELEASRVTGAAEFARFAEIYAEKYGSRPRNENIAEVFLFRLGAR